MSSPCPDAQTLTEFGLGHLPDDRSALIGDHVEGCKACTDKLTDEGREAMLRILGRRTKSPLAFDGAADAATRAFEIKPGDIVAERYRVERVLGEGGMGIVVAARHVALDQVVAMKLLRPELLLEAGAVPRFIREARAASRLKSKHVARVHDLGTTAAGVPYLIMELLEGSDLGAHLADVGRLPEALAAHFISQACEALAEAHANDIVHRDLKPENLFLARDDRGGLSIKILDFGVSKIGGARSPAEMVSTASKALFGSPLYMSPEHLLSAKKVDARSDVWSLGVILYQLVSETMPFDGDSVATLAASVLRDPPRPLLAPVSQAFHAIVERCLQKSPDARFRTASDLGAALAALPTQGADDGPIVSFGGDVAPGAVTPATQLAPTRLMTPGSPPPPRAGEARVVEFAPGRTALTISSVELDHLRRGGRRKTVLITIAVLAVTIVGAAWLFGRDRSPGAAAAPIAAHADATPRTPDAAPRPPDAAPVIQPPDAAPVVTPPTRPDARPKRRPPRPREDELFDPQL